MSRTRVREDDLPHLHFEAEPPRAAWTTVAGRVLGALVVAALGGLVISAALALIVLLWRTVL